jgi:hypothetical protein
MEQSEEQISWLNTVYKILSSARFPLNNEKELQAAIEIRLKDNYANFNREYRFDQNNIVDFFVNGIAIEVKISGNAKAIYKQCERYCQFDKVKSLILVTNRSMGFPKTLNGKACYVLNLGKAWL